MIFQITLSQAVTFLTYNKEVHICHLSPNTTCPDWGALSSSQVPPFK
jgi:hypothetical protein